MGRVAFVRFTPRVGRPRIHTVSADGRALQPAPASRSPPPKLPPGRETGAGSRSSAGTSRPNETHVMVEDELYVAQADGSRAKRLTAGRSHESAPAWSPDGEAPRLRALRRREEPFGAVDDRGERPRPAPVDLGRYRYPAPPGRAEGRSASCASTPGRFRAQSGSCGPTDEGSGDSESGSRT